MKATFFSQQAIFCPQCQTRYALGHFTRSQTGHFAQQSMLVDFERELAELLRVQNLFVRYPLIEALYSAVPISSCLSPGFLLEARVHEEIPEAAEWIFTEEDKEVLKYLSSHHFGVKPRLEFVSTTKEKLSNAVRQSPVFCSQCKQTPLQLNQSTLRPSYHFALRQFLPHIPEPIPMGCWLAPPLMFLLGIGCLYFNNTVGPVSGVFFLLLAYCAAQFVWINFPKKKIFKRTEKPIETSEQVFRGQYFASSNPYFEWEPSQTQLNRNCELLFPDESGWQWLEQAEEKSGLSRMDFIATFNLEFEGVVLCKGRFADREPLRFLVEVTQMRSARLVKLDGAAPLSEELLRSSQASGANREELLRPTMETEETPADKLLRSSEPP